MLQAIRHQRRVKRDATRVPGFIASSFSFESPFVFILVSLWESEEALDQFGTLARTSHPAAVQWAFGRASQRWSAIAVPCRVSRSSDQWLPGHK
jgi:heme-degrading monooxygenase HmoA